MGRRAPGSPSGATRARRRGRSRCGARAHRRFARRASPGGGSGLGAKAGVTSVTSSGRRSSGVGPLLVVAGPGAGPGPGPGLCSRRSSRARSPPPSASPRGSARNRSRAGSRSSAAGPCRARAPNAGAPRAGTCDPGHDERGLRLSSCVTDKRARRARRVVETIGKDHRVRPPDRSTRTHRADAASEGERGRARVSERARAERLRTRSRDRRASKAKWRISSLIDRRHASALAERVRPARPSNPLPPPVRVSRRPAC